MVPVTILVIQNSEQMSVEGPELPGVPDKTAVEAVAYSNAVHSAVSPRSAFGFI